ncbi:MAG TPA: CotH kinase family protein, partial [Candidatus Acidoferrum sp.]|nr:CotH kinase family protein [Candidatus Acidoferrum sp.]
MSHNHSPSALWRCVFAVLVFACVIASAQNIVINEIMYHPASHDPREEYVELHNREATNVNVGGWELDGGVDFVLPPNTVVPANGFVVVAGNLSRFQSLYPDIGNVVGSFVVMRTTNIVGNTLTNWENTLSNTRNTLRVLKPNGDEVDEVAYADEGEWAQRQRGILDAGYRGWTWFAAHDGLGSSLELINPALPNEHGQNWGASQTFAGSPGSANSIATANIPPLIINPAHFPLVPRSTNSVSVTARIVNETVTGVSASLAWRADALTPGSFTTNSMFDDGANGDGVAGDGIYGATIPQQTNNAIVEFFIIARDAQNNTRTWPAPALAALDAPGPSTQSANALFQVDNSPLNDFAGTPSQQPVYKVIMTAQEANDLQNMPCSVSGPIVCRTSEAEMNATFISTESVSTELRYFAGIKRRGHGSRTANPRNYRLNFPSDRRWKNVSALVLNTRQVHIQHLGAVIANKAGAAGAFTRAVQVRVNNGNMAETTGQMFGSYAANEVYDSDWAENHFPFDDGGNAYKVIRDIVPPTFDYRGTSINAYTNTYFKESNSAENDWLDLITMLSVMGENAGGAFTEPNVRQVINPEQWLTHLAVMNILANAETGLNSGYNDDYFMYRGVNDPRFILVYHDLDSVFTTGMGSGSGIFTATQNRGIGNALNQFMRSPSFQPLYYTILHQLLDTTFSAAEFNATVDATLGSYVSSTTIAAIKTWMNDRRNSVQGQINGLVPP